ncbi:hypothetical protein [Gracilimonas mengyeensis]|uniref:Outer membrane protein beta-barrel domain-containing protein n=1 Tax=Gracilimonas mengyeensis TaxID=1302730 RepID=A0A521AQL9_9BACT|nr:hypothetical protein [Gracilimonas mengyeensis]SMO36950.1 hypothetical protein SAMN06265219_101305 [Gracilimonas mengyeensis]
MFSRILAILFIFLGVSTHTYAQVTFEEPEEIVPPREPPISSIYAELFGNAYYFSLNYDYIGKNNFGIRVGITPIFLADQNYDESSLTYSDEHSQSFQVLLMPSYFIGHETHRLELGAGFIFGFSDNDFDLRLPAYPSFTGTIGYRLLPNSEDITVKVAFTPIFSGDDFFPRVGISVGYIF